VPAITFDEVLHLRHPDHHRWSPAGGRVAFIWHDYGRDHLWLAEMSTGEVRRLSNGQTRVTEFDWHPRGDAIAFIRDKDLWVLWDLRAVDHPVCVSETPAAVESTPLWSPDGSLLAFARDGRLWLWQPETGATRTIDLPGRLEGELRRPGLRWSPDGAALACVLRREDGAALRDLVVVAAGDGRIVWQTSMGEPGGHVLWIDAGRLYYAVTTQSGQRREHYLVAPGVGASPRLLHVEQDAKGLMSSVEPQPSLDRTMLLFVLRHTGWDHLFAFDLATGWMRQLTDGACEDIGQGDDPPRWSPDGRQILFSSSRTDLGHRQLWSLDVPRGAVRQLTFEPGTATQGAWSPDGDQIVYSFCGPIESTDLWLMGSGGEHPRRLTRSLPASWTREKMIAPEHVTFTSARDWTVHGYLYSPPVREPGKRYPALVWVHGGPMAQVRDGWHPTHGTSIFHAFILYLAHRGYVTLTPNYRGGTGYGVGFEQGNYRAMGVDDVADVVAAGQYLKQLPYVDPDRVGVWGISYGGHLTLGSVTKHPDVFAVGVNIAGVWDRTIWNQWASRVQWPAASYFRTRLGGSEEQSPDLWRQASPRHWVHQMTAPLVNLHGTGDESVSFEQLDQIVRDCVRHGRTFETHYYPEETHVFTYRRTWADAFRKIERAFREQFKTAAG
jgi:dipeptidyl aminopeptidase/acylaminoacyl peptidase